MIRCNLSILLAERNSKIAQLSKETSISIPTLTDLAYNRNKAIQFNTINKICLNLGITPNDLISFIPIDITVSDVHLREISPSATKLYKTTNTMMLVVDLFLSSSKKDDVDSLLFSAIQYTGLEDTPDEYEFIYISQEEEENLNQLIFAMPIPFRSDLENIISEKFRTKYSMPDVRITIKW